jgi:hypothetical protein
MAGSGQIREMAASGEAAMPIPGDDRDDPEREP